MSNAAIEGAVIERRLELRSSPERVWRALTQTDELKDWWSTDQDFDVQTDAHGWFRFEGYGRFAIRVEAYEPISYLAWRWARAADTPLEAGHSTLVEWRLTARDGGGTDLHLRESGFIDEGHLKENTKGWDEELAELEKHLGEQG
jgi:uncharacterized protein YndB with AHSA1/START domain